MSSSGLSWWASFEWVRDLRSDTNFASRVDIVLTVGPAAAGYHSKTTSFFSLRSIGLKHALKEDLTSGVKAKRGECTQL